jgi:NAD(P)-dependent dehydrogenase (short-subunit alcohol dehydrogenase family)
MGRLVGKTVFITGGLSGIGKACAMSAAQEGANIAIVDLNAEHAFEVMEELRKINNKAMFIECDVSDHSETKAAIEKTIETFSSLDVALNNAGIGGEANRVGDLTKEAWRKVLSINLDGVFYCMKYELTQMMKQRSGCIINISSILGKVGFANSSHYVAAKHGVLGLTKAAALEYATDGIRVNAICPAFIDTPLLQNAGITDGSDFQKMIVNLHPVKRLGTSEEIASAFVFLASDNCPFMTGAALDVDGGYLIQ